ncbi:MAG: hypothetical protein IJ828_12160 [Treponema sp.]|nr:hypothetical protein [Treponema sp.]
MKRYGFVMTFLLLCASVFPLWSCKDTADILFDTPEIESAEFENGNYKKVLVQFEFMPRDDRLKVELYDSSNVRLWVQEFYGETTSNRNKLRITLSEEVASGYSIKISPADDNNDVRGYCTLKR